MREDRMHVDARGRQHGAVVDAGADHHADACAVQHQPEADADHDRRRQDDDPVERIGEEDDRAVGATAVMMGSVKAPSSHSGAVIW